MSRASSGPTKRPVKIISLALLLPIRRGRRCVPPALQAKKLSDCLVMVLAQVHHRQGAQQTIIICMGQQSIASIAQRQTQTALLWTHGSNLGLHMQVKTELNRPS